MRKTILLFILQLCVAYAHSQCNNNNHPHLVNLNLPSGTLWSCCNLGANTPTDYGNYYLGDFTTEDILNELGNNEVPTLEQFKELSEFCSYSYEAREGVDGVEFTGSNGNKIFMPLAASLWYDSDDNEWGINNKGSASYWTRTPSTSNYNYFMEFYNDEWRGGWLLCWGDRKISSNKLTIRPVAINNQDNSMSNIESYDDVTITQNARNIIVQLNTGQKYNKWELYNIDGKQLGQGSINSNSFQIDNIKTGNIILRLTGDCEDYVKKLHVN